MLLLRIFVEIEQRGGVDVGEEKQFSFYVVEEYCKREIIMEKLMINTRIGQRMGRGAEGEGESVLTFRGWMILDGRVYVKP